MSSACARALPYIAHTNLPGGAGTRYGIVMGILQDIQRLNKFQTRKHKRDVVHAQQELLKERIEHVHFGDDGEVESVEIVNGLEALILEQPTLIKASEAKRRGDWNFMRRQAKRIKDHRRTTLDSAPRSKV